MATPCRFVDGVLSSIDLDLDLVVAPDLTYVVEDEATPSHRRSCNSKRQPETVGDPTVSVSLRMQEFSLED